MYLLRVVVPVAELPQSSERGGVHDHAPHAVCAEETLEDEGCEETVEGEGVVAPYAVVHPDAVVVRAEHTYLYHHHGHHHRKKYLNRNFLHRSEAALRKQ